MLKYANIIFLGLYCLTTGIFTLSSYYSGGISAALDTLGTGMFWYIVIFVVVIICIVSNDKKENNE